MKHKQYYIFQEQLNVMHMCLNLIVELNVLHSLHLSFTQFCLML
jgi:hypothetical protein